MNNRHPADELADVRERIRELAKREGELVEMLKQPEANLIGDDFSVTIKTGQRRSISVETAERIVPKPLFDKIVVTNPVTRLVLRYRPRSAA